MGAEREGPTSPSSRPVFEEPVRPAARGRPVELAGEVAPDPDIGATVGPYALLAIVGRGGAGTVFKARHRESGRIVALKVLAAAKAKRARIVQRFFDEVRAASLVRHPGLIEVYDFIEEEAPRRLAYAMEFVDGESLRQRIRRDGALELRTAVAVGLQICEALGALHQAGIIHRDLKPENILLVNHDGGLRVKLLDFGVVKFLPVDKSERKGPTDAGGKGTFVGTPRYMAPEQAAGASVDHRADLFALGVLLFEMITGRCPHEGDSLRDVVLAKLKGAPRITVNPEQEILPQELTEIVDACLKLQPGLRPASAAKVQTALSEAALVLFAVGRPVKAPSATAEPAEGATDPAMPSFSVVPESTTAPGASPSESSAGEPFVTVSTPVTTDPRALESAVPRRRSPIPSGATVVVVVATAVALAVAARLLTQQGAVLVLPEPDAPASAEP